jgi:hypothetical protein
MIIVNNTKYNQIYIIIISPLLLKMDMPDDTPNKHHVETSNEHDECV